MIDFNFFFVCWLINVAVDVKWLQHKLSFFDKYEEHLPMVNEFFALLTFPFLMQLLSISSFRFLFLLKTVIGSFWNKSWSALLILSIFQCFRTILLIFGKKRLQADSSGGLFCVSLSSVFFRSSFLSIVLTFENCWLIDFLL